LAIFLMSAFTTASSFSSRMNIAIFAFTSASGAIVSPRREVTLIKL